MAQYVLVSVGTNYQRMLNVQSGMRMMAEQFGEMRASSWYASAAVGFDAAPYWNGMVGFYTSLAPVALKQTLRAIEDRTGRVRRDERGQKSKVVTLDLDIVAHGGHSTDAALFELAHLVVPLADLHPDWVDPRTRCRAGELAWRHVEEVYRLPTVALTYAD
ncbi:2-amino-4-hydroxy-6-hydroxymethyldihydropteridine diphosphokinase [Aggregatilineales bacterium SYSU G02658]